MLKRLLLSLPLWLAYSVAEIALNLIGLVILLPLSLAQAWRWRRSKVWPDGFQNVSILSAWKGGWLTWLWGNEEDGVTGPPWWQERRREWPMWQRAYVWSALRNPSNNMRFIPGINPVINPERIRYYDTTTRAHGDSFVQGITLTWQGPFSGLLALFNFRGALWRFWWGWKLKPQDAQGVPDSDMRKPRCGFAIQLKRVS